MSTLLGVRCTAGAAGVSGWRHFYFKYCNKAEHISTCEGVCGKEHMLAVSTSTVWRSDGCYHTYCRRFCWPGSTGIPVCSCRCTQGPVRRYQSTSHQSRWPVSSLPWSTRRYLHKPATDKATSAWGVYNAVSTT